MQNRQKAATTALILLVSLGAWASPSMDDLRRRAADIQKLKCSDLEGWQEQLDYFAETRTAPHLLLSPAEKCMSNWTPSIRACFDNLKKFTKGRERFANAGETQERYFGDRFHEITDLSDIFECSTPAGRGKAKMCKPFANWADVYLECIRDPKKNESNPNCKKVEGWCAVRLHGRHHEGIMDLKETTIFFDPKRQRFILNFDPGGPPGKDQVIEMLNIVEPKSSGEYRKGVFSTFYGGMVITPNNHSAGTGCWHCHPDGAPRRISPLWGSVLKVDQKGFECINSAIDKMGSFSTDHLWDARELGPGRGHGQIKQSCLDCHTSDPKNDHSYAQRGKLIHTDQLTREMFAKMTSWNPTMPPGATKDIPDFDKAMRILDTINQVDDKKRETAFRKYVQTFHALAKENAGNAKLEFPAREPERAEKLLRAHRDAKIAALYSLGVPEKDIELVRRVLVEIDRRGLRDFLTLNEADERKLREYLGGGKENCLVAPQGSRDSTKQIR